MRDFQKSKLYAWEREHVIPKMNKTMRDIPYLETLCSYMWNQLGMSNPPKLFVDPDYKTKSTGGRYKIRFMESMLQEWVLVHEMAHSLNLCEHRETYDMHGPNFVADYCRLLTTFYGFDINYLLYTLNKDGVKIDLGTYYGKL